MTLEELASWEERLMAALPARGYFEERIPEVGAAARGALGAYWLSRNDLPNKPRDRMRLLRNFCGTNVEQVREECLGCLMRADHSALAKVYCCIATKPADA